MGIEVVARPLTRRFVPPSPQRGEGKAVACSMILVGHPPLAPLGRGWLGEAKPGEGQFR